MYTYETALRNLKHLKQYIGNRSIVIWGASIAGERFKYAAEELGIKIEFFVDGNGSKTTELFKGYQVFTPDVLSGKSKDYYVVISSRYYPIIENHMKNYGYEDLIDYRYVYHKYPDPTGKLIMCNGVPIGTMPSFKVTYSNVQFKTEHGNEEDKEYIKSMLELYNKTKDDNILEDLIQKFYEQNQNIYKSIYNLNKDQCLKNNILIDNLSDFDDIEEKIIYSSNEELIYISNNNINTIMLKESTCKEFGQPAIIKNQILKDNILLIEHKTCFKNPDITTPEFPLYLLYTKNILNIFFQLNDVSKLVNNDRIVWLLKNNTFEEYFNDVQTMLPSLFIDLAEDEFNLIESYNFNRKKQKEDAIKEFKTYYKNNSENIITNIKKGSPRVMFVTDYFEFEVNATDYNRVKEIDLHKIDKLNGGHTINSMIILRDMGCNVLLVTDISKIKRKDLDFYLKINEFKPDIIFFGASWKLGYFRFMIDDIPDEVVSVTWVQDPLPFVMAKNTPSKLGKRDFILNHYISYKEFFDLGYKKYNLIDAPIPGNDKVYKPYELTEDEITKYSCDICIFGSISKYDFEKEALIRFGNNDFVQILSDILNRYKNDLRMEIVKEYKESIREYLEREIIAKGIIIRDEYFYKSLSDMFFTFIAQTEYRLTIIDWLIDNGYTNIKIWGRNWEEFKDNPKYSKYINGVATNGDVLSKILQSSKIVIGNNNHTTAAARVWETMLSKGFYMSNYIPPEHDAVDLRLILKENEEFVMFHNKKELLEKIDYYLSHEEERQRMIEIGYKKAKELMTFEVLMKKMLKEISERL